MRTKDMLRISAGNLVRLKLRSALTISGVVIAIGAFVAMLSFATGNQRLVSRQFDEMGLLTTMIVYPPGAADSSSARLDDAALADLAGLPGVRLAYPYEDFDVSVTCGDSTRDTRAQVLPPQAQDARLFSRFAAGGPLAPEDASGALVTEGFLEEFGIAPAESALGLRLRVAVRSVSVDSAFARLFRDDDGAMRGRWEAIDRDSVHSRAYVESYVRREAGEAARRFVDGYVNAQAETADTLTVRGVLRGGDRRAKLRPVVVPIATARRFSAAGPGGDPEELLPALLGGRLFGGDGAEARGTDYSQVTLILADTAPHAVVADSVEARGYRSFSYLSEFDQMRRAFAFFHIGLAAVGLVALTTAALGIVNTMFMSISERRREIGVLRALGADERDIHRLFLAESALIGAVGSAAGVLLGWGVARAASVVVKEIMRRQDVPPMEVFATPPWLVLSAIAFGICVAIAAGALPAARAARVDPVEALRTD